MHICTAFLKRSKAYCADDLCVFMLLHGSCSRSLSHPDRQSRSRDIKDSVILNNWLEKVSIAIIESLIQFINFNLLMFHLAHLYCCWNSRTFVFFSWMLHLRAKNLWFSTKALPTITWQRMYACAYDLSIWLIHVSQSVVSMRNYHTTDAAITVHVCSQLKVTRIGAMKQSEVTHIVMQWRGFFFFYLWVSFSIYPFCLLYFNFYFHYHLPAPSLSHARWGKMYAGAQVGGEKSIVRVFEVFWETSQGRRSCQGDR